MTKKKIVVAFSGGLDTSYTVMRLANEGNEVYAACANTGGFSQEQLKKNEEKDCRKLKIYHKMKECGLYLNTHKLFNFG